MGLSIGLPVVMPVVMNGLTPVYKPGRSPHAPFLVLALMAVLALIGGVGYGCYLLYRLMVRAKSQSFSLALFVFYFCCWGWWMACSLLAWMVVCSKRYG